MPHPEELAGTLVVERLVRALVETVPAAATGFRCAIVPVADPDGMTLNAPWAGEPYDLEGFLTRVSPARAGAVRVGPRGRAPALRRAGRLCPFA